MDVFRCDAVLERWVGGNEGFSRSGSDAEGIGFGAIDLGFR